MRTLFSVVSLLVVLAIVGLAVSKQMKKIMGADGAVTGLSSPPASAPGGVIAPRQMEEKIRADVVRALEQGAQKEEPNP